MDQIRRGIYKVTTGERVTVKIVATKVGNFSSFVLNGEFQTKVQKTPRIFQFTAMAAANDPDFGEVQCFFPNDAPADAFYQVFLQGSVGDNTEFTGPDIFQDDKSWRRGIEFRV